MLHVTSQGQLYSFAFRPVTKNTYNKTFFNSVPKHNLYLEWVWQGILNVPTAAYLRTVDEAEHPEKYRIRFPASKKVSLRTDSTRLCGTIRLLTNDYSVFPRGSTGGSKQLTAHLYLLLVSLQDWRYTAHLCGIPGVVLVPSFTT